MGRGGGALGRRALRSTRPVPSSDPVALDIRALYEREAPGICAELGIAGPPRLEVAADPAGPAGTWYAPDRTLRVNACGWVSLGRARQVMLIAHELFHAHQAEVLARARSGDPAPAAWAPVEYVPFSGDSPGDGYRLAPDFLAYANQPTELDADRYAFSVHARRYAGQSEGLRRLRLVMPGSDVVLAAPGEPARRDLQGPEDTATLAARPLERANGAWVLAAYDRTTFLVPVPARLQLLRLDVPECRYYDAARGAYLVIAPGRDEAEATLLTELSTLAHGDATAFRPYSKHLDLAA